MFAKEAVNKGRQTELDIAKAVLIFIFAFVHVTIRCSTEEGLAHGLAFFFDSIIGGPLGAPTLIFSMGVGMVYARKIDVKSMYMRGIKIFVLSYALNTCRFVIPYLIGYAVTGDYEKYIEAIPYLFGYLDVMQFAGLAFILMAFLLQLNLSKWVIFIISLVMSIISNFFNGLDLGSPVGNILVGHFIGTEDAAGLIGTDFPVLNWFIVVASGYLFGSYLIKVRNKKKFYLVLSPACVLAATIYFTYGINNRLGMFGEGQNCYYHISTSDVIGSMVVTIGLLGVYYAISLLMNDKVKNVVAVISKNINTEYCVHWVLVVMTIDVFVYSIRGSQELPMTVILPIAICISLMSIFIAWLWKDKLKFRNSK